MAKLLLSKKNLKLTTWKFLKASREHGGNPGENQLKHGYYTMNNLNESLYDACKKMFMIGCYGANSNEAMFVWYGEQLINN